MKITEQFNWNRRDFSFKATCEHCGHEETHTSGYDDYHYYNKVVPDMKCGGCGESSNSKPHPNPTAPKTIVVPKYRSDTIV